MSDVRIRAAAARDRNAAVGLWMALHREHETLDDRYCLAPDAAIYWGNSFDGWVRDSHHLILVGEADNTLVGLLVGHAASASPVYAPKLFVHIDDLYVEPSFRGQGVGRRMLARARAWAQAQDIDELQVGVLAANSAARAFWSAAGSRTYALTMVVPLAE